VESRRSLDLAGQSAVWATFRCTAIQQFVLYVRHGWIVLCRLLVDVDMAGSAHCCATTLSNDAFNPLRDRSLHACRAFLDFDGPGFVGWRYEHDFPHMCTPTAASGAVSTSAARPDRRSARSSSIFFARAVRTASPLGARDILS